jgi:hypothetical protein
VSVIDLPVREVAGIELDLGGVVGEGTVRVAVDEALEQRAHDLGIAGSHALGTPLRLGS